MKRKFEIDCDENVDIDALMADVFEKVKGGYNCNYQYFKHAEKLKEGGKANSTNKAAEIISNETGESKEAVRQKIIKGEKVVSKEQEQQQTEIIGSEQEKDCEYGYDKEIDDLCQQLKRRIRMLQKTNWTWGIRSYVLDVVQGVALKAAKK